MERINFRLNSIWTIEWQYERVIELLENYKEWNEYTSFNDLLELFNLYYVVENSKRPESILNQKWEEYQNNVKEINSIVARNFSMISGETLESSISDLETEYKQCFWNLFFKYQLYKKVNEKIIKELLENRKINILHLLHIKDAVNVYGRIICEYLKKNIVYARELIYEYLERKNEHSEQFYFPKELTIEDKINIVDAYIDSGEIGLNTLHLLSESKGNKDSLLINDKMRLKAKKKYEEKSKELFSIGRSYQYGVGITYRDQEEVVLTEMEGASAHLFYDIKWIINNLDYSTLLNNFIYLFGFVDMNYRWNHISKENDLGLFEGKIGIRGKREYIRGSSHNVKEMVADVQMATYYCLLRDNGVDLEDVIKWFFENYMFDEFGAEGFVYNKASEKSNFLEKCRNIAIEIDSVLKQYNLYCEDGKVDRELFELSTQHMLIENVNSKLVKKYVYPLGDEIKSIFNLLYSDQSLMLYGLDEERKHKISYEVLLERIVNYSELKHFQCSGVDYLVGKKILKLDEDNNIVFSKKLLKLLYDLYENEFGCTYYLKDYKEELKFLEENNYIKYGEELLSIPEQNYFNYIFNNSKYDNSKDLRNKFAHGNQSLDEKELEQDYYIMLRMMILVILKINEELCLTSKL